jgi:hypothetical protein
MDVDIPYSVPWDEMYYHDWNGNYLWTMEGQRFLPIANKFNRVPYNYYKAISG